MRATLSLLTIVGMIIFVVPTVSAEDLEVRLISLNPSQASHGDIVTIVIGTTAGAECGGLISVSGARIEAGASAQLPTVVAFAGEAGWRFKTVPVPAHYTITITCSSGYQKGKLVTSFYAA